MDSTAVILGTVFIIGLAGAFFYWDELPQSNLAGAAVLEVPELMDQQELNLCMNACMLAWFFLYVIIAGLSRILQDPFDLTFMLFSAAIIAIAVVFARRAYRNEEIVIPFITPFLKKNVKGF